MWRQSTTWCGCVGGLYQRPLPPPQGMVQLHRVVPGIPTHHIASSHGPEYQQLSPFGRGLYPLAMVCDNDTPDDCFILEICVVLIIEFLIYIFILLSSLQTMFFKVKVSMEVFEKNNTRKKKSALKKNKIRNMTNTREILFIYLLFRKHLNPFRLFWRMSSTGQSSQQ